MQSFVKSSIARTLAAHARVVRVTMAVALAATFTACERKAPITGPGALATITVTPNPQSLAAGATQQFTAVGKDASGTTLTITPVWSIVAGGGTINATTGIFTAGSTPGTFTNTIMAASGGISGTATVTVTVGPLATIVVTPTPVSLAVGGTQTFVAVGRDAAGNAVAITPVWSVAAGGGSINATTGAFTAGTVLGTFANTVKATSGAISGTATVTVTAGPLATIVVQPNPATLDAGANQTFTAVGRDVGGNIVPITPAWSVVNGGGSINANSGLFTAGAVAGTFGNTVMATSGSISGTATVIVKSVAPVLTTITVTPNPASLATNAQQQFSALGKDQNGNVFVISPVWSVVNGGGSINASTGLFTAGGAAGTFSNTVVATSGTISGTATVTVTAPPPPPPGPTLATITVTPNPATVGASGTQQFTATGRDANGNIFGVCTTASACGFPLVWSVVNGGGSINATNGVFTAGTVPGTYTNTVKASSGSISGTATVIVTAGPLATIVVTPNPTTVAANDTQQFTATGRDASGNLVTFTPVWAIVNGGGSINSAGLFTAGTVPGTYNNTVRASSGTITGNATVTVTAGPLATIIVTPNPASVPTNGTQQFSAAGQDASGNPVAITPVWAVVNGGGSINPVTGFFTAGAVAGAFNNTVRATSGTTSGTATVNVTAPPPGIVDLASASPNGIMAGTAVSCAAGDIIHAGVTISPGSTISGPCVIDGQLHLNDATAIQAQIDLTAAYNTLAGLPCPPANVVGTANIGGTTRTAGVYCSGSTIGITGALTLDGGGDPNASFVFQAGSSLTTAGSVILINGAQARNVFFVVGSDATLGTASAIQGNIIALTSITLVTDATIIGRALARNGAVTLGTGNIITLP